jgi:hypothetical protein
VCRNLPVAAESDALNRVTLNVDSWPQMPGRLGIYTHQIRRSSAQDFGHSCVDFENWQVAFPADFDPDVVMPGWLDWIIGAKAGRSGAPSARTNSGHMPPVACRSRRLNPR